jgi:hypothetical protein
MNGNFYLTNHQGWTFFGEYINGTPSPLTLRKEEKNISVENIFYIFDDAVKVSRKSNVKSLQRQLKLSLKKPDPNVFFEVTVRSEGVFVNFNKDAPKLR